MILLPEPKSAIKTEGTFTIGFESMIVITTSCPTGAAVYADMMKDEFVRSAGFDISVTRGECRLGDIALRVDETLPANEYKLSVTENGAEITGGTLDSLGCGTATMRQLVRQYGSLIPCVEIEDFPAFEYRGYYHDVTRGRIDTLSELYRLADKLSFYKINQLQLYIEHTYLFRGMSELWRDETPLTSDDILALDTYCCERGIELVPSLSSFGHLYKLLSTVTHSDLCELSGSEHRLTPFYFEERMNHHTINVSNEGALPQIKRMISEYMDLFRSDKFNICADETFDLGAERSHELAESVGYDRLYVDYIKELFNFLIEKGKTPMFWGDIISRCPELISELPDGVIFVYCGYSPYQNEYDTKSFSAAGATQYLCPCVAGWNMWINSMNTAYKNISIMTGYAKKYGALGILNTDWGDCGHINQPVFSVPGLIYGAVGAWCGELPDYDALNRDISILEFGDPTGTLISLLGEASGLCALRWGHVVHAKGETEAGAELSEFFTEIDASFAKSNVPRLAEIENKICALAPTMQWDREVVGVAKLSVEMLSAWNEAGAYIKGALIPGSVDDFDKNDGCRIASKLEELIYRYAKLWRKISREGDIRYVIEVFSWYADLMRCHALDKELKV